MSRQSAIVAGLVFIALIGVPATSVGAITSGDSFQHDTNGAQGQETTTVQNATEDTTRLEVQTVQLQNVTARNVSVARLQLPNGSIVTNVTAAKVTMTGRLEGVTLRNTTINNETLAEAIGQTNGSVNTITLENEEISGIVIENLTVAETSSFNLSQATEVNITMRNFQSEPSSNVSALGPAALEIGDAHVESATAESFRVINLSLGAEADPVGTTTAEAEETTTEP